MVFPSISNTLLFSVIFISSGLSAPAEPHASNLQGRWISINPTYESGNAVWPDKTVKYCFRTAKDKKNLHPILTEGWGWWLTKEKTIPNGLKLEPIDGDLCNPKVLALEIFENSNCVREASGPGYKRSGAINRHTLAFDKSAKCPNGPANMAMAHELGHVFGLYHEHQRPDAGAVVKFNCENLKDYDAFKKGKKDRGGKTMDQLCQSVLLSSQVGFSAKEFATLSTSQLQVMSSQFDRDSVMMYSSSSGALPGKASLTWADGSLIQPPKGVSDGDMQRLAQLYPVGNDAGPAHPGAQPAHPAATPAAPKPAHPVATPAHPAAKPAHPTHHQ